MPARSTVLRWLATGEPEDFVRRYATAKQLQADLLIDDILDIADDGRNDWVEVNNEHGECVGYRLNSDAITQSRLHVEARMWLAERLQPKKYGRFGLRPGSGEPRLLRPGRT